MLAQITMAFSLDMNDASRKLYVSNSDAVLYLKAREYVSGGEENKKAKPQSLHASQTLVTRLDYVK